MGDHPYADCRGYFHLRCEVGHNIASKEPNHEKCGTPLNADGSLCVTTNAAADADHLCDAEIWDRIIDYEPVNHNSGFGADLHGRTLDRMTALGIPQGTDDPTLLALGAKPLLESAPFCAGRSRVSHERTRMVRAEGGWLCAICGEVVDSDNGGRADG